MFHIIYIFVFLNINTYLVIKFLLKIFTVKYALYIIKPNA